LPEGRALRFGKREDLGKIGVRRGVAAFDAAGGEDYEEDKVPLG